MPQSQETITTITASQKAWAPGATRKPVLGDELAAQEMLVKNWVQYPVLRRHNMSA
jgi:hypothetical protein